MLNSLIFSTPFKINADDAYSIWYCVLWNTTNVIQQTIQTKHIKIYAGIYLFILKDCANKSSTNSTHWNPIEKRQTKIIKLVYYEYHWFGMIFFCIFVGRTRYIVLLTSNHTNWSRYLKLLIFWLWKVPDLSEGCQALFYRIFHENSEIKKAVHTLVWRPRLYTDPALTINNFFCSTS